MNVSQRAGLEALQSTSHPQPDNPAELPRNLLVSSKKDGSEAGGEDGGVGETENKRQEKKSWLLRKGERKEGRWGGRE